MRSDFRCEFRSEPSYIVASHNINDVWKRLDALHIHRERKSIRKMLAVDVLPQSVLDGTMGWTYFHDVLITIVYAMRYCVGDVGSRSVLYKERVLKRNIMLHKIIVEESNNIPPFATASASFTVHADASYDSKWIAFGYDEYRDGVEYALDFDPYNRLTIAVRALVGAEKTHTTAELGVLFADTLADINEELNKLDILLTNAWIQSVRDYPLLKFIDLEAQCYRKWFDDGMGTHNTEAMILSEQASSSAPLLPTIQALIFNGFLSHILTPGAETLSKIAVPETFLLDIGDIREKQGRLYGLWAQAALLVVVGQRLSEASTVSSIDACLRHIIGSEAFYLLGRPDTCRAQASSKYSVSFAVGTALREVSNLVYIPGLIREVERETSNFGYPTTPIASAIARKWSQEMRGVVTKTSLSGAMSGIISATTFCPATFLPKAASGLGESATYIMADIVQRVNINVAVHMKLYNKLYAKLAR